jgi:ATP-dependent DNA helicase RecG
MFNLNTDIQYVKGVGEKRAQIFKKAGIKKLSDLIYYFPRDWKDFSKIKNISDTKIGESGTFLVKLKSIKNIYTRRRRFIVTEAFFSDNSGTIKSVWFNQPYVKSNLKKGELFFVAGTLDIDKVPVIKNPSYESADNIDTKHLARITPIFREIDSVSSRVIRNILKPVIDNLEIQDFMPHYLLSENNLLGLEDALKNIHFPKNNKRLNIAKKRLSFDEVFLPQVLNQLVRKKLKSEKSYAITINKKIVEKFIKKLDFSLTKSQKKSLSEIFNDISNNYPMNRLLEGDVGSGKTIVAATTLYSVVSNGFQGAIMVPTEVLAWEHYKTIEKLLKSFGAKTVLVTGSTKAKDKKEIYKQLANGEASVIIGTHSLLNDNLKFKKLALAIIDEQHRFGVNQRKKLRDKNKNIMPHLLSMTATPIPRSYALTVYGDLDISVLTDMPRGLRKTKTFLVPNKKRKDAYEFIKKHIKNGSKAIVICPAVLESDKLGIKAVEAEYEKLKKDFFSKVKIDILHGKMKTQDKQQKIDNFKNNKIDLMVSTTVIEVGLNIKNLNVMMIENAERFGLSQLHQLRGRVGRAGEDSYFLMFSPSTNPETLSKLKEVTKINDGFKLAELDLSLRGQGDIFGTKQSGMPELRLTSFTDYDLLKKANKEAINLISKDPELNAYPYLRKKLGNIYKEVHAE